MSFLDTIFPIDVEIPADQITRTLDSNDKIVGLCFRPYRIGDANILETHKVIWSGRASITPALSVELDRQIVLTSLRSTYNSQDHARFVNANIVQNSSDIVQLTSPAAALIPEFRFVFIDVHTLRTFCNETIFDGGKIYASRAVSNFFVNDNEWGNYRTLKFSPHRFPVRNYYHTETVDSTAYYLAPSCPPTWKTVLSTVVLPKFAFFNKPKIIRLPIYSHKLIEAFNKAGVDILDRGESYSESGIGGFQKEDTKIIDKLNEMISFYKNL